MVIPPEWLGNDKPFLGKWDIDTPVYSATNVEFMGHNARVDQVPRGGIFGSTDLGLAVHDLYTFQFNHSVGCKNSKWGAFGGDLVPSWLDVKVRA